MGKCWGRRGKVCRGVGVRGSVERSVGKCVGRGEVWEEVHWGSPCLPHTSPHFLSLPIHFNTLPYTSPHNSV